MKSAKGQERLRDFVVNGALLLLVFIWTIPTLGLLVSSFRTRFDIQTSGWWKVLPHREWVLVEELDIPEGVDPNGIMTIEGVTGTFDELREGITGEDGRQITWSGNKRLGTIRINEERWVIFPDLTFENYGQVLAGKTYEIQTASGDVMTVEGDNFVGAFLNSVTVAIPATIIPILIAAFAAYGFAWMKFPGRRLLFVLVVALLVIPLQIALVPILKDYVRLNLNGTFLSIWLAHTGFGLPLATYLLFNYIKGLPRDILESAFIDGASHFTIFVRLIIPLSLPALASFAIFQFLWVWNDYLVALVFIGAKPDVQVLTMRIAEMVGSRGADWHLLTAGAFISMLLPLVVFFSLQRFFVRGMLAGSVKG
ncbi:MAG: ABC transporter permease subunit [Anaerolineales bacterium]|nr:ABC transporter permease subunit [Anaerolineales bacterium]